MLELIKAVILGIIQGVTEWLPISSTGHMVLFDEFLKMNVSTRFRDLFFVIIQLGSIMAVVVLFFKKLNPFLGSKNKEEKIDTYKMWFKVAVASVPVAVCGLLFDDHFKKFCKSVPVAVSLIAYGVVFIVIESINKKQKIEALKDLDYKTAILIGAFQVLSLIPGTSRSGSTIIGAMLLGTSREVAMEFTFFLAIPVMFGASFLKLLKYGLAFSSLEFGILLTGSVVAFVVSLVVIKFCMTFVKKHDFKVFGYYRILLGSLILLHVVMN